MLEELLKFEMMTKLSAYFEANPQVKAGIYTALGVIGVICAGIAIGIEIHSLVKKHKSALF